MKTKLLRNLIAMFCVFVTFFSAFSQTPGQLDAGFNNSNAIFPSAPGTTSAVYAIALQPDGKVLVGGSFSGYNNIDCPSLIRVNEDGSKDGAFAVNTNGVIKSIVLQPDGKIIVAGSFTYFNEIPCGNLVRINADGSLDTTFNTGTGANGEVKAVLALPDGSIILGGTFTTFNNMPAAHIAKIGSNGVLDQSFGSGLSLNNDVKSLALQSDGKILIGGWFTGIGQSEINRFARLNTDGTLDATFNTELDLNADVCSIVVQPDGKIIIGGDSFAVEGNVVLLRFNENGTEDTSFNASYLLTHSIEKVVLTNNGKILVGGSFFHAFEDGPDFIARLNTDGSIDTAFNEGAGPDLDVLTLALQPDGKIILGGNFYAYNKVAHRNIVRIEAEGSLDYTFNKGTGADNLVNTILKLDNDKAIIGGAFTTYNGKSTRGIAKIDTSGAIDTSFTTGSGVLGSVVALSAQPDGKIIIGGGFTEYNGTPASRLARLNPNGTLDAGFVVPTFIDNTISAIALNPDGKIIVGGLFTSFNDAAVGHIIRLNPDGSPDATFTVGLGANNTINVIKVLSNGKILIGGSFTQFNGAPANRIVQLNPDGTTDTGFSVGSGFNGTIYSIAIQADGKILVAGLYSLVDNNERRGITRLNPDGSNDATFNPGWGAGGANPFVYNVTLLPNGKIMLGGYFEYYDQNTRKGLVRINTDGSTDTTFNPGTGINSYVRGMTVGEDGNIIIVGNFMVYDGILRDRIAKVFAGELCTTSLPAGETTQVVNTDIAENATIADLVVDGTEIKWYDANYNLLEPDTQLTNGATYFASQTVNGCESELLAVTAQVVLSLNSVGSSNISYYPNPVKDNLNIVSAGNIERIEVYTLYGQKVATDVFNTVTAVLDMKQLQQATYLVRAYSEGGSKSFLVVKN